MVNRGESYVLDVPSATVARLVKAGKLSATTDFAVCAEVDAVSICVPTPLRKTGDPDLSFIVSATEGLAPYVHPGMVVVLESSTYPGTTREMVLPRLTGEYGLTVGEDIFIAFSPERVDPGRTDWTTKNTPKVVGGITETARSCSRLVRPGAGHGGARLLYRSGRDGQAARKHLPHDQHRLWSTSWRSCATGWAWTCGK